MRLIKFIVMAIKSVQNRLMSAQTSKRRDSNSVRIIQMQEDLSIACKEV